MKLSPKSCLIQLAMILRNNKSIALSIWLIKMVANISLSIWAACRSLKLAFRIKPKYSLITILGLFVVAECLIKDLEHIRLLTSIYANIGLGFIILLVPCLFVITLIKNKNGRKLQSGRK
ncbi:GerAB/ArcD/ProY family transporter [Paenibacillus sp. 2TAB23]|uniref:GerAB/ArcD/ProY family transporter n=1 Tax=Paenibacillus sp. 2TAB23 TaxID=3233004 RepID=UPI003F9A985F